MSDHLTPLAVVERMIGHPTTIADICGLTEKAPYVWRRQTMGRDAGDFPSAIHQRKILAYARAHNIPLTAEHLIFGAGLAEIEALLGKRAA